MHPLPLEIMTYRQFSPETKKPLANHWCDAREISKLPNLIHDMKGWVLQVNHFCSIQLPVLHEARMSKLCEAQRLALN